MATRNFVPRADGEGSLGTSAKKWGKIFAYKIDEETDLGNNASLGYRQPSTAYTAGQIKYHSALPTGWYLECTTGGTSGSGALTISTTTIGTTITDGTVTWTLNKNYPVSGGTLTGNTINRDVNTDRLSIFSGGSWNEGAQLTLFGRLNDNSLSAGSFELMTVDSNQQNPIYLKGLSTGALSWNNNDLGGSAIVAKSLGANGYIKYASGLIVQWGSVSNAEAFSGIYESLITFPVSFSNANYSLQVTMLGESNSFSGIRVGATSVNQADVFTAISAGLGYIAIGY